MTTTHAVPVAPAAADEAALGRRHWSRSGWLPAALVATATAATVLGYGVSVRDLAAFAGYAIACVALPGTLLWRALHGRSGAFAVDAAAGLALGLAVEIAAYTVARALGVPLAVLAWPVVTVVAFAAVPRLRRHWRGGGDRVPAGVAWATAGIALFLLAKSALFFRAEGLVAAEALRPNVDLPFQIALVGELRHHMPPAVPFLRGESLAYHWFLYAHAASASWVTGVEAQVLILRLLVLPLVAALLLLVVGVARAVSGRWWPGPVALLLLFLGLSVSPYGWTSAPVWDGNLLDTLWLSPTMTLMGVLGAASVLTLVGLVRGTERRAGAWVAMAVLVGAAGGAKATFVPMLVGALGLVVAVRLLTRRRPGPALPALGVALVWLVFVRYVLLAGGASYGTVVAPLALAKWSGLGREVLGRPVAANHWVALAVLTGLGLLACGLVWAGAVGVARRGWRLDPAVLLLAFLAAAGYAAAYLLAHPGIGSLHFLRSGRPYAALLAAVGLAALLAPAAGWSRRRRATLAGLCAGAAGAGLAAVYAVRATVGRSAPAGPHPLREAVAPYAVLLAVLLVLGVALVVAARALRTPRPAMVAAVAVLFAATGLTSGIGQVTSLVQVATSGHPLRYAPSPVPPMPAGAIPAMRWLRDNSDPDDLVATNHHCRYPARGFCDSRHFWIAAFAERRVLIEGWSYTEEAMERIKLYSGQLGTLPYWDPRGLAENDAVFTAPTATNVRALAARHGVRWLVAVGPEVSPELARHARLRYTEGAVSVLEIQPG